MMQTAQDYTYLLTSLHTYIIQCDIEITYTDNDANASTELGANILTYLLTEVFDSQISCAKWFAQHSAT